MIFLLKKQFARKATANLHLFRQAGTIFNGQNKHQENNKKAVNSNICFFSFSIDRFQSILLLLF
jgi:hypothetical protein